MLGRLVNRRNARIASLGALVAALVAGCGGSSPTPGATLRPFITAWSNGRWTAMRAQVADPPKDFVSANAGVFTALGVSHATITSGRVRTSKSGNTASAAITQSYQLPHIGVWSTASTVHLVKRGNRWRVKWTPQTIDPRLKTGDTIAVSRVWPARAPILGAGGVNLTAASQQVVVGVVGQRIKQPKAVRSDLIAAGAPRAQVSQALAAAKQHPTYFEPIFT